MRRPAVCIITAVLVLSSFWFLGVLWSARGIPPPNESSFDKPLAPVLSLNPRKKRDVDGESFPSSPPPPPPPPLHEPSVLPDRTRMCFNTNTPEQVTDDRGYVCSPFDVLDSKCCNLARPYVRRFVCDICTSSGCCESLEICVSCCMGQDENRAVPERRRYQQCTSVCRTSHESLSVDQRYKSSGFHHCFQRRPPKINKAPIQEKSEIEWMSLD